MDQQLIKSLIDALAASDLSELEYSAGEMSLRLVKGAADRAGKVTPPIRAAATPAIDLPRRPAEPEAAIVAATAYGIVHLHRGPGNPQLVATGDAVMAGQVLCLIEAMKVFTELRAEQAGTVAAVLVESGQEVEVGQPLFRVTP